MIMKERSTIEVADTPAAAAAWLDAALPPGATTVAFVGVGIGAGLEALAARGPGARAIVLEPDATMADGLRERFANRIAAGRLAVLAGPDYAGASAVARTFGLLQDVPVLVYPPLAAARPDAVAHAREALSRLTFQANANDGARRASAARYLTQTLANAPRLSREGNAGALTGLFPGRPAVIVAAGPSLDRNVHDLAPVLDRAIVIACDTAARPLLTVGIEPDLIVATDSSRANAGHLSSLPASRSFLVAEGSLHASAFAHFDSRTFAFRVADHHPWPWLRSIGLDCAVLDTWGSVATSALSLAIAMGCDPIVFMGTDFAFTGGRPYCRGTSFEPVWASWSGGGATPEAIWQHLLDRWPAVFEPDLSGQTIRTARHLVSFRDWIVDRTCAERGRRFVNATGAGLLAGPAIEQQSASATLAGAAVLDRALIRRLIQAAHGARPRSLDALLEAVTVLLSGGSEAALQSWLAFAAPAVTPTVIECALHSPEYRAWALAHARYVTGSTSS